jgi:acyl carrier protein
MVANEKVAEKALAILKEVTQNNNLSAGVLLELSSLQILNALAKTEREFGIEVEDEMVFHGVFASAEALAAYIIKMGESDD